jgi:hypothetical protein
MAQVDKVSYLPLIFWFLVLGFFVYWGIGFFLIPKTHAILKLRRLYYLKLMKRFRKYLRQFRFNLRLMGKINSSLIFLFGSPEAGIMPAHGGLFRAKKARRKRTFTLIM